MKTRFNTLDICAILTEINKRAVGLRLVNVYDIDNKTYLFKLAKPDVKAILLVESGIRMHFSEFDWPKNPMPSGFAMKMRKHLRRRRLVSASQLGIDRIIDLQFGSEEAAYHVFIELYDKGNIALTDYQYIVLNLLRFRKDQTKAEGQEKDENEDVRFAVHQPYPYQTARPIEPFMSIEKFVEILNNAKKDSLVKRILNSHLPYGAPCIEHCLCVAGFSGDAKLGKEFIVDRDAAQLHAALLQGEEFISDAKTGECKGYLIQKYEKKSDGELLTNVEFHPFLFEQHKGRPYQEFITFNQAVDEFFGSLASQKNDLKALQRERAAYRKLDNVRRDHENRLQHLRNEQDEDKRKAWIIESNLSLVDQAIKVICSAIANQVDWDDIRLLVADAQAKGDKVAMAIKSLKLETNSMTMLLSQPSLSDSDDDSDFLSSSDEESKDKPKKSKPKIKPIKVDIDLSVSAYANVERYYNKKRNAAQKEQRTMDASSKALKSAEKKTKQTLKEAAAVQTIQKARKIFWFEKFLWFISSENYLVLGGRDAQQNELLVKKYLNAGDVYVHADLHGATSCIIKNPSDSPVPPKTLNEAGTMAICHSAAWDAKVVTSAWWVHHDQVSKTAPSGEYLTTGSFLIRGKKNYLPPSYLVYGFGFLFKVDETCIWKHKGERKVRSAEDDLSTMPDTSSTYDADALDLMSDEEDQVDDEESLKQNLQTEADDVAETPVESESYKNQEQGDYAKEENSRFERREDAEIEQNSQEQDKEDSSDTENDVEYPDTSIKMPYDLTSKYQLSTLGAEEQNESSDNSTSANNQVESKQEKPRMSAKQRREQKKMRKQQLSVGEETQESSTPPSHIREENKATKQEKSSASQPSLKRGQKKKMRKIKEKYKDQDEEDRKLMMEILQSANPPKTKEKKGKNKHNEPKKPVTHKDQKPNPKPVVEKTHQQHSVKEIDPNEGSDEEREIVLKAEHLNIAQVDDILDSLTGVPAQDDILLFAIPVCAPYNTMQNYKFKVKLTPGSGKKGKAAKTAISMFHLSRDTTQQEKDHLRSVKDHDLSRNMPGKVKVSAPNLQKQKFKGKRR